MLDLKDLVNMLGAEHLMTTGSFQPDSRDFENTRYLKEAISHIHRRWPKKDESIAPESCCKGYHVMLTGLVTHARLNGTPGKIIGDADKGRLAVQLADGSSVSVRPVNVVVNNNPQFVDFAPEDARGPPQRCVSNVARYVATHPGAQPVRSVKLYVETNQVRSKYFGAKAVLHFIVRQPNGRLLDVTHEPGDTWTFCVPVDFFPEKTDAEFFTCTLALGGFMIGEPEYVKYALHVNHLQGYSLTTDSVDKVICKAGIASPFWSGLKMLESKTPSDLAASYQVDVKTINRWISDAEREKAATTA